MRVSENNLCGPPPPHPFGTRKQLHFSYFSIKYSEKTCGDVHGFGILIYNKDDNNVKIKIIKNYQIHTKKRILYFHTSYYKCEKSIFERIVLKYY